MTSEERILVNKIISVREMGARLMGGDKTQPTTSDLLLIEELNPVDVVGFLLGLVKSYLEPEKGTTGK